ncbi:MAG: hypothetical protein BGN95_11810 [Sphingomonas sp. 66-10]|nr:MAG: hypothetical protein BGN95_11810 [Sphingomonas sp. 66-10]
MDRSSGDLEGRRTAVEESEVPRRRFLRSRRRRIGAAAGAIAVAAFGVLWVQRVPIATDFIDRELARDGVTARYRIADLGPGRQRLTDVVIGDPADPDLVADWVETYTAIGLTGPYVAGVSAGHVRLRAQLADGKLSLGTIDRLLPARGGKGGLTLPAIDLAVEDARVRLTTPYGVVGLKIAGNGRLDNGFRGTVAALGKELTAGGCTFVEPNAVLKVAIGREGPRFSGPVGLPETHCGGVTLEGARIGVDAALGAAFDRWSGSIGLRAERLAGAGARAASVGGTIAFAGNARRTEGTVDLGSGPFALPAALGERLGFTGKWRLIDGRPTLTGEARARGAALDDRTRGTIARAGESGAGTPIAPLARNLAAAVERAARRFDVVGTIALVQDNVLTLSGLSATAASGARLALDSGGVTLGKAAGWQLDGAASLSGGGFPTTRIALHQPRAGAPLTGTATVAPYAAGGAKLALAPVSFASDPQGRVTIRTAAALSGPLADGAVENLRLPLIATVARGGVTLNPMCTPLAFDRLAAGGLVLRPARLTLCPTGRALFDTRTGYGARIAATRLEGTIGSSPVTLAATGGEAHAGGFALAGVEARIGPADRPTALDFARIDGAFGAKGLGGTFSGGAGQIAHVPLLLSAADGRWTFAGGVLDLTGALAVADAAASPRFVPLAARNVALRLADGVITTTGELRQPTKDVKVADVTIRHTLASGAGTARLAVPGVTFGKDFQPDDLTKLTFGVIADVQGRVTGEGDIAWNAAGVTSTGAFRTGGLDLAAAFGPVTGLKGEIRFTDLLALESAPGQVATVASINPGVPVTDGRIVYQTLANTRVKVESARWPFAGGELTLDPALLDFSVPEVHRLIFRVNGAEAAQFLQQFDFKNLDATGVFDGSLPIAFDESGGRVESGHLIVRPGGGGIAYVGELTAKDLGTWGNIAFQALKSLRYKSLDIVMDGPLAGEMVTEVRFAGVSQGEGAKSNFLIRRLQKLPFVFNVRIKAPFRGLLDSVASFYDPKRLIERNLPALLEEQEKQQQKAKPPAAPVQPTASEKMP